MHAGGRPLVIAWRDGDDPGALQAAYQAESRRDIRPRLHALWRLRCGDRIRDVARLLGVHERNVQRWVAWYRADGRGAVTAHRRQGQGKAARLTAAQQAQLAAQAATGAFRTSAEVRQWVRETFGVTYTAGGMYAVLGRLDIHPKVPRPSNPKADPQEQARWKGGAAPRRCSRPEPRAGMSSAGRTNCGWG
jgi:transposase